MAQLTLSTVFFCLGGGSLLVVYYREAQWCTNGIVLQIYTSWLFLIVQDVRDRLGPELSVEVETVDRWLVVVWLLNKDIDLFDPVTCLWSRVLPKQTVIPVLQDIFGSLFSVKKNHKLEVWVSSDGNMAFGMSASFWQGTISLCRCWYPLWLLWDLKVMHSNVSFNALSQIPLVLPQKLGQKQEFLCLTIY